MQATAAIAAVEQAVMPSGGTETDPMSLDVVRTASLLVETTVAELAVVAEVPPSTARRALDEAARAGWGQWEEGNPDLFAVHPSVARALALRFRLLPRRAILARAARTLSERGDGMRAFMLAFDAEDDELILRTGSKHLSAILPHHRQILVRLERIPRHRVIEHPLIAFATAACQAQDPRNRIASVANFVRAERLSRPGATGSRATDRVVLLLGRSATFAMLGRFAWSENAAEAAVALLESLPPVEHTQLYVSAGVVYGQLASARFASGDIRGARQASSRASGVPAASSMIRHHELSKEAFFAAVDGDVVAARGLLDDARQRPGSEDYTLRCIPALTHAIIALESGDPAAARRHLESIPVSDHPHPFLAVMQSVYGVADILEGESDAAIRGLRAAHVTDTQPPLSSSDRAALGSLLALALLATGDVAAVQTASRSLGRYGGASLVTAARALAAGEDLSAVMDATTGLSGVRTIRVRVGLLLVRAAAAARMRRTLAARRDAVAALTAMRDSDVWTPWLLLRDADRAVVLDLVAGSDLDSPEVLERLRAMPVPMSGVRAVPQLTRREHEVLLGVFARETNAATAARLGVSPNTVKKQRAALYRKLGVSTWEDAVTAAIDIGLLDADG